VGEAQPEKRERGKSEEIVGNREKREREGRRQEPGREKQGPPTPSPNPRAQAAKPRKEGGAKSRGYEGV
jgi:hypothetical protein